MLGTLRDGHTLGAFCAIDSVPRAWHERDLRTLHDLAAVAVDVLEARRSNRVQDLPAPDLERQVLVNHLAAEAVAQTVDADDRFGRHQIQPIQVKNTAKKASRTMTRKIACTTADVVRVPTCSASPSTSIP